MQGHRYNQNITSLKKRLQILDSFGKHAPQNIRRGSNLVVFEQMNQLTQAAFIAAVGRGLDVRRFETAAQAAKGLDSSTRRFGRKGEGNHQPLATNGTQSAGNWSHRS